MDERLITRTHFKSTDCNSYIPVDSYDHRVWLRSTPCSQFLRLRGNCTEAMDYERQALLLKDCFLQKGYMQQELNEGIEQVTNELLRDRDTDTTSSEHFKWFLVSYSVQHKQIKNIMNKYWTVLKVTGFWAPFCLANQMLCTEVYPLTTKNSPQAFWIPPANHLSFMT